MNQWNRKKMILLLGFIIICCWGLFYYVNKPEQVNLAIPQSPTPVVPMNPPVTQILTKGVDGSHEVVHRKKGEEKRTQKIKKNGISEDVAVVIGLKEESRYRYAIRSQALRELSQSLNRKSVTHMPSTGESGTIQRKEQNDFPSPKIGSESPQKGTQKVNREIEVDRLSGSDWYALLSWLVQTDDFLREDQLATLKNDVMNQLRTEIILRNEGLVSGESCRELHFQSISVPSEKALLSPSQGTFCKQLIATLLNMLNNPAQPIVMRDYAIQHLGSIQKGLSPSEQSAISVPFLNLLEQTASGPAKVSYIGTALIALQNAPKGSLSAEQQTQFDHYLISLVSHSQTHEAARITAIQIACERTITPLFPLLQGIVADETASIPLRIVAIRGLANLASGPLNHSRPSSTNHLTSKSLKTSQQIQVQALETLTQLRTSSPNPRLLPALGASIRQLSPPIRPQQ